MKSTKKSKEERSRQKKTALLTDAKKLIMESDKNHSQMVDGMLHKLNDANVSKNKNEIENRETGETSILEEVEKAISNVDAENDKSPGVDNIPAEILKHGGPGVISALSVVCQKV